ncbi:hypothetical protein ANCDUO_02315 [Ancylostoma duodenale]|uniref:DNA helicase Pif1-like 2B domain-containing protein n=1 Tax=Ancylostoma duodenale TaxID=51022 RepID=A0A0C2H771_9BILA|nr:hypothetical protein ANCDUO_02315 [Ancylostoma duodenale]
MRVYLQDDLSDGAFPVDPATNLVSLPPDFCNLTESSEELITKNHQWFCDRAILAPMNDSANKINTEIQKQLPGHAATYDSIDTVVDREQAVCYPTDFMNSLEPADMPPHRLLLKVGSPIMLLRNIDPPKL